MPAHGDSRLSPPSGEYATDVLLIPASAHGTNPASASMCGMTVVPVACDARRQCDLTDLEAKATLHRSRLAAPMVTHPSTHGVFEEGFAGCTRSSIPMADRCTWMAPT